MRRKDMNKKTKKHSTKKDRHQPKRSVKRNKKLALAKKDKDQPENQSGKKKENDLPLLNSKKSTSIFSNSKSKKPKRKLLFDKSYLLHLPHKSHFKDSFLFSKAMYNAADVMLIDSFYEMCEDIFDAIHINFENHDKLPGYALKETIKNSMDAMMMHLAQHFEDVELDCDTDILIHIKIFKEKHRLIVKIKDNGPGFSKIEDTDKHSYIEIFPETDDFRSNKTNPTYITENKRVTFGGQGIGLADSQKSIFYLKNRKEKGATVAITVEPSAISLGEKLLGNEVQSFYGCSSYLTRPKINASQLKI